MTDGCQRNLQARKHCNVTRLPLRTRQKFRIFSDRFYSNECDRLHLNPVKKHIFEIPNASPKKICLNEQRTRQNCLLISLSLFNKIKNEENRRKRSFIYIPFRIEATITENEKYFDHSSFNQIKLKHRIFLPFEYSSECSNTM